MIGPASSKTRNHKLQQRPSVHRDHACAAIAVIISMPAKAPRPSTPKAAMMPSVIGTRQATRAVVDGTRNARISQTTEAKGDHTP
jgi:hypothetical protein